MIDLRPRTIKRLFEQQILNLTTKTVLQDKGNVLGFRFSERWF